MELFRRTLADINIENLVHNWEQLKKTAGDDRFICPMVKANAYGHGAPEISLALEKEGALVQGVCLVEEGLQLRAAGVHSEILVFRGFDKRGAEKMLEYQLTPVVSSWPQIYSLEAVADEPVKVHLKFNTGMNRLGFAADQADELAAYFKKTKKLKLKALCTHLISGEAADIAVQTKLFSAIRERFSGFDIYDHVLNSGGIGHFAKLTADRPSWGFRPGLMLYGYQPGPEFNELNLLPVMTLKSVINNIQEVAIGESVSYGRKWRATRSSRIAAVPIGYADGIHRLLSNRSQVLVAGQRASVVGTICMDFLMIDMTEIMKNDDAGKWIDEEVILFGFDEGKNFISADELAIHAETITWEILTSVSARVPRHFKGLKKT